MSASMTVQQPVKGMVWKHASRTQYTGEPVVLTVTSIGTHNGEPTVFSRDPLWSDQRVKTPLRLWEQKCLEVVSVPEPKAKVAAPKRSEAEFAAIMHEAHEAGLAAGAAARPTPMTVVERANPLDDTSRIVRRYEPFMDGVCGFAYINTPGNEPFGRYVAKHGWHKAYYGGMERGVRAFDQSMERKGAYAAAYVEVLRAHGINATYSTRMD